MCLDQLLIGENFFLGHLIENDRIETCGQRKVEMSNYSKGGIRIFGGGCQDIPESVNMPACRLSIPPFLGGAGGVLFSWECFTLVILDR